MADRIPGADSHAVSISHVDSEALSPSASPPPSDALLGDGFDEGGGRPLSLTTVPQTAHSSTDLIQPALDAVSDRDEEKLTALLQKSLDEGQGETLQQLFEHFSTGASQDESDRQFFLTTLAQYVMPELSDYVVDINRQGDHYLTSQGVDVIAKSLIAKGSFPKDVDVVVCGSLREFSEKLDELKASGKEGRTVFIVSHKDHPTKRNSAHFTPIVVEKKNGQFQSVISDSVGADSVYAYPVAKKIKDQLDITPYSYEDKRQHDSSNCSIFSLRDAVSLAKEPNIFKDAKESYTFSEDDVFHRFNLLPPSMMKITQDKSTYADYPGAKDANLLPTKKTQSGFESLDAAIRRHQVDAFDSRGKPIKANRLAIDRFNKYENLLIGHAISQRIKTPR